MGWQEDIKKAFVRCEVPVELWDEAMDSFHKSLLADREVLPHNLLAPLVTIPLLWKLPREAEALTDMDDIYGNEAYDGHGLNGDKRGWLPSYEYDTGQRLLRYLKVPTGPEPSPMGSTYKMWVTDKVVDDVIYGYIEDRPSEELVYWGWDWVKSLYKLFGGEIHPRNNFCRWLWIGLRNRASKYKFTLGEEATPDTQTYGNANNSTHSIGEGFYRMGNVWQYRSHTKLFKVFGRTLLKRQNIGFKIDAVVLNKAKRAMVTFTPFSIKGMK